MFLAHKSSITELSYKVLDQYQKKKVLVNDNGVYKLVSNICTHQQSLLSITDGKGARVCPYHNWSFKLDGTPLTSGRTEYYCKNTENLKTEPVYEWNGLLFDSLVEFDIDVNLNNLVLLESRVDVVNASPNIIMDLFLDVDHIQTIHAGVYDLIDIHNTDVEWKYYNNGSVQTVKEGARWIAVYPNTMIEWQRGSMFITVAIPSGEYSNVYVFKYMDKNYVDDWKLNESVWETAWSQDKNQAELLIEFSQQNLEQQKIHFRDFLKYNGTN
jgi:phenylpropionate dioxygenase-like ring-hydroxylating dioxygenase large terminal subunit